MGRGKQIHLWGSPASQTSLRGGFQASEGLCSKQNRQKTQVREIAPKESPQLPSIQNEQPEGQRVLILGYVEKLVSQNPAKQNEVITIFHKSPFRPTLSCYYQIWDPSVYKLQGKGK